MTAACPDGACYACWNATGEIVPAKVNAGGLPLCPRHAHERSMSSSARKLPAADGYERPSVDATVGGKRAFEAYMPDGKPVTGGRESHFRHPAEIDDAHPLHMALVFNGVLLSQTQPTVHVNGTPPAPARPGGTSRGAARVEARLVVERVTVSMSTREGEAYRLRHVEGLSRGQIAVRLGMTVLAVKHALERAASKARASR